MSEQTRPLLAITMGDPAGVGPEVIVSALRRRKVRALCRPLIIGDLRVLRQAAQVLGCRFPVRIVASPDEVSRHPGRICLLDLANADPELIPVGRASSAAGRAAAECIFRAVELTRGGAAAAMVTAPINKEALGLAGIPHAGHTEMLSSLCGGCEVAMMLIHQNMRVSHVSTHISLRQACDRVRRERILSVIRLTDQAVRKMIALRQLAAASLPRARRAAEATRLAQPGRETRSCPACPGPRIAVAGLNPHAGESGLFGDEETREIAPAVADARAEGIDAVGPLPPDTVFARHRAGEFDAVVAMVHDQGHIAVKTVGFAPFRSSDIPVATAPIRLRAGGVNLTLGLPIIRTSVDHGTAFEIAGKGIADATSMVEAIKLAAQMAAI